MAQGAGKPQKTRDTAKPDTRAGWTIKPGPSPETREACKKAARRRGMTLSAWIEQTLRQAATDDLKGGAVGPTQDDMLRQVTELLKKQEDRLDQLEQERRRPWWRRMVGG